MDDIQKIKDRVDIVELIGEYVQVKKAGRNFKALCPFHGEKTPSFAISGERQVWHCFGCGKGGDIFTFLQEYEKLEFSEALKDLASRAGVKLSMTVARSQTEQKKDLYYSLNHLSSQFYNFLLLSHPVGKKAFSYLEKRKISVELMQKFGIGYAPGSGVALSNYLMKKKSYKAEEIVNAGLGFSKGRGIVLDFFRDRIIFPIRDSRGNVIAFSGRVLEGNTQAPKYINTRETLIYKKGDTLYGIFEAKDAIKKESRAIVVEGEFDVISSFREGIPNTVAVKGTALTEGQVRLLKRYTEKVSFCFDMDSAGIEAMSRSIPIIEKANVLATVIQPPDGKDPDEVLRENPTSYKMALKNDVPMYDFLIEHVATSFNSQSPEGKKKILEKVLPQLSLIENEVIKEHYYRKLAGILDTSFDSITRQAEKQQIKAPKLDIQEGKLTVKQQTREETIEFYLLSLLLQSKDIKKAFLLCSEILSGISLTFEPYNRLYLIIKDSVDEILNPTIIEIAKLLPTELLSLSDKCYLAMLPHFADEEQYYDEIRKTTLSVKQEAIKTTIKKISAQIKVKEEEGKENEVEKLHQEFSRYASLLKKA